MFLVLPHWSRLLGKYDEAIALYQKAIETCPKKQSLELATYYQNRAAAYEQLKKWSAVIADCSKALEYNSKYEKALFRRAKAYESLKDYENCLDDITAVCLLQGFQNHNAMIMADRVLKGLGKLHAAEAFKNKTPQLPSNQFIKTYFMSFSEDPVYEKLMDVEVPIGEGEVAGFLRAKLAFATDNFDEVVPACMEEIFTSESESQYKVEALALRASFYLLLGMHKEALDDFHAIIENPDADVKIRVNCLIKRGSLYMQMEETSKCMDDMMKAATLGPNISGKLSRTVQAP